MCEKAARVRRVRMHSKYLVRVRTYPLEPGQHAHRGDQPEGGIARDRKGEADDVRFAGTPVAVKNSGRARHVYIARTLNVGWYQFLRLKRANLARRGVSLQQEPDFTTFLAL